MGHESEYHPVVGDVQGGSVRDDKQFLDCDSAPRVNATTKEAIQTLDSGKSRKLESDAGVTVKTTQVDTGCVSD